MYIYVFTYTPVATFALCVFCIHNNAYMNIQARTYVCIYVYSSTHHWRHLPPAVPLYTYCPLQFLSIHTMRTWIYKHVHIYEYICINLHIIRDIRSLYFLYIHNNTYINIQARTYIYIYIYIYILATFAPCVSSIHNNAYMNIQACIYIFICMYLRTHYQRHLLLGFPLYTYTWIYKHVHIYVYTFINLHIISDIHSLRFFNT